jgi:hypothetical protein
MKASQVFSKVQPINPCSGLGTQVYHILLVIVSLIKLSSSQFLSISITAFLLLSNSALFLVSFKND